MKKVYLVSLLKRTETDLGDDARLLFILPDGGEVEVCHAGRQSPTGTLDIRVKNGTVRVIQSASNTVHVEVTDATNVRPNLSPSRPR